MTRFEHLQPDHLQPNHSIWTIALKGGEPTLRPPPLLVAALFLAAGDLLGLWMARSGGDGGSVTWILSATAGVIGLAIAATSLRAVWMRVPRSPPGPEARMSLVGVTLIGLAGTAVGRTAGAAAAGSCVAGLRGGEDVAVRGLLLDPIPAAEAGGSSRRITIRVGQARLAYSGQRCEMPKLGARVWPTQAPAQAGNLVVVGGVWRAYPQSASLPVAPDRYGVVQGRVLALERTDGAMEGVSLALRSSRLAARLRERAADRLRSSIAPDVLPTGRALILADRTTLDPAVRERFRDAGIGHLLAISGLHIGVLAGGGLWCLGLWIKDWRRYPIAVLGTGLYVLVIGAPPSAVRAFLLFAGYSGARLRGAPASLGDLAGLAVTLALLFEPLVILHPSFQLSFAGFAGIIAGGAGGRAVLTRVEARWNRSVGRRWRAAAFAVIGSLAAFLFTAPFAAAHFGRIVPAAIFSSIVGSSLVALALPALILTLVLPGPLASWAGAAASSALRLLDAVAARFAALPLHWETPTFGTLGWLGLIALAATIVLLHVSRRGTAILLGGSTCAAWIGVPALVDSRQRGHTLVCSLDVGQGDATVVRTQRGRWILVDAGPGAGFTTTERGFRADPRYGDAGRGTIVPFLRARGVRNLELLVLSHPHLDHFGGSAAVLDRIRVRRVLDAGFAEPSAAYSAFLDRLDEEGALWLPARAGLRLRIDEVELFVLWPPGPVEGGANEHSVVFRLRAPGIRYLNTGDAPSSVEREILDRWPPDVLFADLLKLGHHGSRTSASLAWLRAVGPEVALISAGRANRHGHPHPGTLARLDSASIPTVWRTDLQGNLCIEARAETGWRILGE